MLHKEIFYEFFEKGDPLNNQSMGQTSCGPGE